MMSSHKLKLHSTQPFFKYAYEDMQSWLSAYVIRTITEPWFHFADFELSEKKIPKNNATNVLTEVKVPLNCF